MTPRKPPIRITLADLDDRLTALGERTSNIEQILIRMEASSLPKWAKAGGWYTIVGAVVGAALKVMFE